MVSLLVRNMDSAIHNLLRHFIYSCISVKSELSLKTHSVFSYIDNWNSKYLKKDEVAPDVEAGPHEGEVRSDITTSFFILLAIFFPSVTGRVNNSKGYPLLPGVSLRAVHWVNWLSVNTTFLGCF